MHLAEFELRQRHLVGSAQQHVTGRHDGVVHQRIGDLYPRVGTLPARLLQQMLQQVERRCCRCRIVSAQYRLGFLRGAACAQTAADPHQHDAIDKQSDVQRVPKQT